MENREAIRVFRKIENCSKAFYSSERLCFGNCDKCENGTTEEESSEALALAIYAMEFKERYDQFWEEVKAAGKSGKETEIHHSGRVFRIREVAQ